MKYAETESSFFEFKREMPKNNQIIKTITGFCNRYGGKIIIDINDDRTIIGVSDHDVGEMIYETTSPPLFAFGVHANDGG